MLTIDVIMYMLRSVNCNMTEHDVLQYMNKCIYRTVEDTTFYYLEDVKRLIARFQTQRSISQRGQWQEL